MAMVTGLVVIEEEDMKETLWLDEAACALVDDPLGGMFFSEDMSDVAAAKAICATCPVMAQCLEGAILRQEPSGVWGGQLFKKGEVVMIRRRVGRPPKVPRPEDTVPMVPIPDHLLPLLKTA